jgi:hypothetical protein
LHRYFEIAQFHIVLYRKAQVAELVDALVSGTSIRMDVQVRVLFWAQRKKQNLFKALNFIKLAL